MAPRKRVRLPVVSLDTAPRLVVPEGHAESAYILSLSGGKDSTAAMLALIDAGIPFLPVFADTGWEHPLLYEYLDTLERVLGVHILRVGEPDAMRTKIRERAGFPARIQRWCTRELKVFPIRDVHRAAVSFSGDDEDAEPDDGTETVSVVGLRAEESAKRAALPVFELDDRWSGYVWRPLLGWTVGQVLAIHHRFGVPINPLYRLGFNRVGCFPCIYANKDDIRLVAEVWPERIDEIESLEQANTIVRAERNEAKPDRYAFSEATFFQSREVIRREQKLAPATAKDVREERATAVGEMILKRVAIWRVMNIRRVVEWSRTAHGGKQYPMFREPEPDGGCFRWGLCDAPARDPDPETP